MLDSSLKEEMELVGLSDASGDGYAAVVGFPKRISTYD